MTRFEMTGLYENSHQEFCFSYTRNKKWNKNKNLCDITANSLKCLGYFPLTSLLSNQRVVHHVDFSEVTQDELLSFTIQIAFKIDKTGISSFCILREITRTYYSYFVFCILYSELYGYSSHTSYSRYFCIALIWRPVFTILLKSELERKAKYLSIRPSIYLHISILFRGHLTSFAPSYFIMQR